MSTEFAPEKNPHGVRPGQTWQAPDGRQFQVLYLERWTVRGRTVPSARTQSQRKNNRGLLHGFDRCTLIEDAPEPTETGEPS